MSIMLQSWLDDHVMENIFSFLPLRSLLRFRTLNKFWCGVIDSWLFSKLQVQNQIINNNTDDSVCLVVNFCKEEGISMSLLVNRKLILKRDVAYLREGYKSVGGAANGLICIYGSMNAPIVVVNPCLLKIVILPISLLSCHRGIIDRHVSVGFTFTNRVQDYKVLELLTCYGHGKKHLHAQLYTRSTNSWKELALDHNLKIQWRVKSSSNNSSFAHWIAYLEMEEVIVSFDMENEVFEIIEMPGLEILRYYERCKIFAREDGSFILFSGRKTYGYNRQPFDNYLSIYKSRRERNKLYWDFVKSIGPFLFRQEPKPEAIWKDYVILKQVGGIYFYDICSGEYTAFPCPQNFKRFKCFEYQPSLIRP